MHYNSKYYFEVRVNGYTVKEYDTVRRYKNGSVIEEKTENESFIEGRRGSEYTLHFRNNSSSRVLVVPSVDGLSVIDGKPASHTSQGYVVDAWGMLDVPGWTIDNTKVAKFQFQPQGDKRNTTYVEELRVEGFDVDTKNQGVIGLMVFEEKLRYSQYTHTYNPFFRPKRLYEPYGGIYGSGVASTRSIGGKNADYWVGNDLTPLNMASSAGSLSSASLEGVTFGANYTSAPNHTPTMESSLGTGFGEKKNFTVTNVSFEKNSETPVWIAVITYDTLEGLKRKGVVMEYAPVSKAFPNYPAPGCYVPKSKR